MLPGMKRPLGMIVVAILMIVFGITEIATGFTHNFLGLISTTSATLATYGAASIGAWYAIGGLSLLPMKKAVGAPYSRLPCSRRRWPHSVGSLWTVSHRYLLADILHHRWHRNCRHLRGVHRVAMELVPLTLRLCGTVNFLELRSATQRNRFSFVSIKLRLSIVGRHANNHLLRTLRFGGSFKNSAGSACEIRLIALGAKKMGLRILSGALWSASASFVLAIAAWRSRYALLPTSNCTLLCNDAEQGRSWN
jgi:hypothetical protein